MQVLRSFKTKSVVLVLLTLSATAGLSQGAPSGGGGGAFGGGSIDGGSIDGDFGMGTLGSRSIIDSTIGSRTIIDSPYVYDGSLLLNEVPIVNTDDFVTSVHGDDISIYGLDLTSELGKEYLNDNGALYGVDNPRDWLVDLPETVSTWRDFDGLTFPYDDAFLDDGDIWQKIQDFAPDLMPVGTDGNSPGVGGLTGGLIQLNDPTVLDWNGGLVGQTSCFHPARVESEIVGRSVNSARLQTVLVASMGKVIQSTDGNRLVYRHETCSRDVALKKVFHCSGIVEPGGKTIWTAAHCLRNAKLDLVESDLRSIDVGFEQPCTKNTKLRAVSLFGLTESDYVVSDKYMSACESIQYYSPDVVRVRLTESLPWAPLDDVLFSPWRWPEPGELLHLIKPGRRLYGSGYPHSPVLMDISGGRVMGMEHCVETLAGLLNYYNANSSVAERNAGISRLQSEIGDNDDTFGGFVCTTLDTRVGGSGGPVFALDDDGKSLILVGLVSGAAWTEFDKECVEEGDNYLQEQCGVAPTGKLNVFALLPPRER